MLYAAIDIGSNAVRLLFANVFEKQGVTRIEKASLIRIPLQLGKDVFKTKKISDARSKNFINTIKAFKLLIDVYKPMDYIACATAAMREAENKDEILKKLKVETGITVHLIDGDLEAKIIRSANNSSLSFSDDLTLLIDVGGGSTELSLEKGNTLIESKSFKLGTIRLLQNQDKKEIWAEIYEWLNHFSADFGKINCLGTGGNINKYAKLYSQNTQTLTYEQLKNGYNELRQFSSKERAEIYGFRPDREDVIIPAGKIYLEIMKQIHASSIIVPRIGLVDGLVLGLYEKAKLKTTNKKKINLKQKNMIPIKTYIKENKERFLDELFGLIRIPSISSITAHHNDMFKAAEYWKKILLEAGADRAEVYETEGNPVTYGEKIIDPALPTVLVYGHMDVMPVDPLDLWNSPPFEPEISDGKIWARGADDDKGQSFMHAKAFEYLVKNDLLKVNVKFMIEGEEEVGSTNLPKWCKDNKAMLGADIILVSDTGMIAPQVPSITTGLRGLSYWDVEVTGPNRDLHSGLFGGAVANPINVLSKMIASILDENNRITIPGFYDDVMDVSTEERELLGKAPFKVEDYKKAIDVKDLAGEKGYSPTEHTGIRPTFDICGIWGGYTGEGAKTVLPSKAFAKVSTRLVPNQNHLKIAKLFKEHFESIAPKSVKVKVTYLHGGQGYVCPIDLPVYRAAEKALVEVYGIRPVPVRSGGSIPIVSSFEEILGIKSILMGFGLESDAIHSPNENFPLEQFFNGIESLVAFYKHFAEMNK